MEFLRFGSSIPGSYWGCCAVDIIQNFKFDPDEKASIQLVSGDSGTPMVDSKNQSKFLGMTYHEIFKARLRINTFNTGDKPNHTFFAVLTALQISGGVGKKWLSILKEEGFEFVRAVDNSVYTGADLGEIGQGTPHINYIFAMYRNIGKGAVKDPFEAPAAWKELTDVINEPLDVLGAEQRKVMVDGQRAYHKQRWEAIGSAKTYTQAELEAAGVPITMAGKRSTMPQQLLSARLTAEGQKKKSTVGDPFANTAEPLEVAVA